jgi:DNA polymerase-3 subunit beta
MLDNPAITATCPASDLAAALQFLDRAIPSRTPIPVLANVAFDGDGTLRTTDLDREHRVTIPALAGLPPFTAPTASLRKCLKGADKGAMISIAPGTGDDKSVTIEIDGLRSRIATLPREDFPNMTAENPETLLLDVTLDAAEARDWLRFLAPCISQEETRYYLRGILLHPAGGHLTGCATDGHRLALRPIGAPWGGDRDPAREVILPRDAVDSILAMLGPRPAGRIRLRIYQLRVVADLGAVTLRTKVIDGTFPEYSRVIPRDHDFAADLDISRTLPAVNRLHGLSTPNNRAVNLDTGADRITLRDQDGDSHSLALGCMAGAGETDFGMDVEYLKDCLSAFRDLGAGMVTFRGSPGGPVKFTAPGIDGLRVVMPMRV